ncbi:hypothetical protein EJ110_NYTH03547 [Nymphaea thermarum]|nr:hypothetical protein EJ110_NYTH03547 [Nymphaea thermarum]
MHCLKRFVSLKGQIPLGPPISSVSLSHPRFLLHRYPEKLQKNCNGFHGRSLPACPIDCYLGSSKCCWATFVKLHVVLLNQASHLKACSSSFRGCQVASEGQASVRGLWNGIVHNLDLIKDGLLNPSGPHVAITPSSRFCAACIRPKRRRLVLKPSS